MWIRSKDYAFLIETSDIFVVGDTIKCIARYSACEENITRLKKYASDKEAIEALNDLQGRMVEALEQGIKVVEI